LLIIQLTIFKLISTSASGLCWWC